MKLAQKIIVLVSLAMFFTGCFAEKQETVATVANVEISTSEQVTDQRKVVFEDDYEIPRFRQEDTFVRANADDF